jgi:hypothetical protein
MVQMVTVFMLATNEQARLAANEVVLFDENQFKTHTNKKSGNDIKYAYYLARIDVATTLVVVFVLKGKKGVEREQNTATRKFIQECRAEMNNMWTGLLG